MRHCFQSLEISSLFPLSLSLNSQPTVLVLQEDRVGSALRIWSCFISICLNNKSNTVWGFCLLECSLRSLETEKLGSSFSALTMRGKPQFSVWFFDSNLTLFLFCISVIWVLGGCWFDSSFVQIGFRWGKLSPQFQVGILSLRLCFVWLLRILRKRNRTLNFESFMFCHQLHQMVVFGSLEERFCLFGLQMTKIKSKIESFSFKFKFSLFIWSLGTKRALVFKSWNNLCVYGLMQQLASMWKQYSTIISNFKYGIWVCELNPWSISSISKWLNFGWCFLICLTKCWHRTNEIIGIIKLQLYFSPLLMKSKGKYDFDILWSITTIKGKNSVISF